MQHSASKFVTQLGYQSGVILNVIHAASIRQTQFSVDLLDDISIAVKRSIGSTTGFDNHGEGPNY